MKTTLFQTLLAILVVGSGAAVGAAQEQNTSDQHVSGKARTYYVSPKGNDSNTGLAVETAFVTINKAAQVATAGDVVNILPGTYVGRVRPVHGGTAEAPIIYRKDGQGEVVITTSKETDEGAWEERAAFKLGFGNNYTVIDGLTFRDAEAWFYIGDYAHHNTVRNCTFLRLRMYHGIYIKNSSHNTISQCKFLDAWPYPSDWTPTDPDPSLADYITIWRDSHYNLIEGNEFNNISHVAVCIMGRDPDCIATHQIIRNNTFIEPLHKSLSLHTAEYTLVEGNRMTGWACSFVQFCASKVIMRGNLFAHYKRVTNLNPFAAANQRGVLWLSSGVSQHGTLSIPQHSRIYNNTFADCEKPIAYHGGQGIPVVNNVFKNNIFAGFEEPLHLPQAFFAHFTTQQGNPLVRNVLFGGPADGKVIELIAGKQINGRQVTLAEAVAESPELCRKQLFVDNLETDPQFVDAPKDDYRLKPGSPCIDAGADLTHCRFTGSGLKVTVNDALYFCDGFGLIDGDMVVIGPSKPARVVGVDYDTKTLTLDRSVDFKAGDPVNLVYKGKAPNIGAFESR